MDDSWPLRAGDGTDPFARAEELCGHRWDGHVLAQLAIATRSLRRTALAQLITVAAREYIADTQLDRALRRLVTLGLVRFDVDLQGRKLYQLTQPGREQAALLRQLVDLLSQSPPDREDHTSRRAVSHRSPAGAASTKPTPGTRHASIPDGAHFAREWDAALTGIAPIALSQRERHEVLDALTAQIHTAAAAEPFNSHAGRGIGAGLVAAGFNDPSALGATITMVTTRLASRLALPNPQAAARTTRLAEQIATGFTQAIRDRALDAQDALHTSVRARLAASHRCAAAATRHPTCQEAAHTGH